MTARRQDQWVKGAFSSAGGWSADCNTWSSTTAIDAIARERHAAIGIDGAGDKHVLALALGATENTAVVKALLADLIERGLRPDIARPAAPAMREHQTPRSE
jgi:Transposase, Mutator family